MYRRIRISTPSDRELATMDRSKAAKEFGMRKMPQFEMVPPQPVHLEGKRSFWNPPQINEMGSEEIRNKIKKLDKADKIVSWSLFSFTIAEMLGFIGNHIYQMIKYGAVKGKLDEIDIGLGIAAGVTLLAGIASKLVILGERGDWYEELSKRAEQK